MTTMPRITPDLEFIKEVQSVGGDSVKKCYQCATCSVACPIAPSGNPYPRKEMIWAQWGLKDKLMSDIDVWLCHNCGNCSDLCPRGAQPGNLLAAIRNMTYRTLVGPSFIGRAMSSAKGLPLLIAIPAILYAVIWIIVASVKGFTIFPEGEIVYGKLFYGDYTIDPIFIFIFFMAVWKMFVGSRKLVKSFHPEGGVVYVGGKKPSLLSVIVKLFTGEILPHKKFSDCGNITLRRLGHMGVIFGFIALTIVTTIVAMGHWGPVFLGLVGIDVPSLKTPLAQINPVKLLANVGGLLLFVGMAALTVNRFLKDKAKGASNYYDWYLLGVIWVVALTGFGAQFFRLLDIKLLAYPTYYVHLIAVFMLFAYAPWSKLGHMVYRTVALVYAQYLGRKAV